MMPNENSLKLMENFNSQLTGLLRHYEKSNEGQRKKLLSQFYSGFDKLIEDSSKKEIAGFASFALESLQENEELTGIFQKHLEEKEIALPTSPKPKYVEVESQVLQGHTMGDLIRLAQDKEQREALDAESKEELLSVLSSRAEEKAWGNWLIKSKKNLEILAAREAVMTMNSTEEVDAVAELEEPVVELDNYDFVLHQEKLSLESVMQNYTRPDFFSEFSISEISNLTEQLEQREDAKEVLSAFYNHEREIINKYAEDYNDVETLSAYSQEEVDIIRNQMGKRGHYEQDEVIIEQQQPTAEEIAHQEKLAAYKTLDLNELAAEIEYDTSLDIQNEVNRRFSLDDFEVNAENSEVVRSLYDQYAQGVDLNGQDFVAPWKDKLEEQLKPFATIQPETENEAVNDPTPEPIVEPEAEAENDSTPDPTPEPEIEKDGPLTKEEAVAILADEKASIANIANVLEANDKLEIILDEPQEKALSEKIGTMLKDVADGKKEITSDDLMGMKYILENAELDKQSESYLHAQERYNQAYKKAEMTKVKEAVLMTDSRKKRSALSWEELADVNDTLKDAKSSDAIKAYQKVQKKINSTVEDFVMNRAQINIDSAPALQALIERQIPNSDGTFSENHQKALDKLNTLVESYDKSMGYDVLNKDNAAQFTKGLEAISKLNDEIQPFASTSKADNNFSTEPTANKLSVDQALEMARNPEMLEKASLKQLADMKSILKTLPTDKFSTEESFKFSEHVWDKLKDYSKGRADLDDENIGDVKALLQDYRILKGHDVRGGGEGEYKDIEGALYKQTEIAKNRPIATNPNFSEVVTVRSAIEFTEPDTSVKGEVKRSLREAFSLRNNGKTVEQEKSETLHNMVLEAAKVQLSVNNPDLVLKLGGAESITPELKGEYEKALAFEMNSIYFGAAMTSQIAGSNPEITEDNVNKFIDASTKFGNGNTTLKISEAALTGYITGINNNAYEASKRLEQKLGKDAILPLNKQIVELNKKCVKDLGPDYTKGQKFLKASKQYGMGVMKSAAFLGAATATAPIGWAALAGYGVYKNIKPMFNEIKALKRTGQYDGFWNYVKKNKYKVAKTCVSSLLSASTALLSIPGFNEMAGFASFSAAKLGTAYLNTISDSVRDFVKREDKAVYNPFSKKFYNLNNIKKAAKDLSPIAKSTVQFATTMAAVQSVSATSSTIYDSVMADEPIDNTGVVIQEALHEQRVEAMANSQEYQPHEHIITSTTEVESPVVETPAPEPDMKPIEAEIIPLDVKASEIDLEAVREDMNQIVENLKEGESNQIPATEVEVPIVETPAAEVETPTAETPTTEVETSVQEPVSQTLASFLQDSDLKREGDIVVTTENPNIQIIQHVDGTSHSVLTDPSDNSTLVTKIDAVGQPLGQEKFDASGNVIFSVSSEPQEPVIINESENNSHADSEKVASNETSSTEVEAPVVETPALEPDMKPIELEITPLDVKATEIDLEAVREDMNQIVESLKEGERESTEPPAAEVKTQTPENQPVEKTEIVAEKVTVTTQERILHNTVQDLEKVDVKQIDQALDKLGVDNDALKNLSEKDKIDLLAKGMDANKVENFSELQEKLEKMSVEEKAEFVKESGYEFKTVETQAEIKLDSAENIKTDLLQNPEEMNKGLEKLGMDKEHLADMDNEEKAILLSQIMHENNCNDLASFTEKAEALDATQTTQLQERLNPDTFVDKALDSTFAATAAVEQGLSKEEKARLDADAIARARGIKPNEENSAKKKEEETKPKEDTKEDTKEEKPLTLEDAKELLKPENKDKIVELSPSKLLEARDLIADNHGSMSKEEYAKQMDAFAVAAKNKLKALADGIELDEGNKRFVGKGADELNSTKELDALEEINYIYGAKNNDAVKVGEVRGQHIDRIYTPDGEKVSNIIDAKRKNEFSSDKNKKIEMSARLKKTFADRVAGK